jgi:NCAIR mutase (PurE)-related protein
VTEHEVKLDLHRADRIGLEEAIFCAHKTPDQIDTILEQMQAAQRSCLLTRLDTQRYSLLGAAHRRRLDYDEVSRTAYYDWRPHTPGDPEIAIVTAGSSDIPVAREALRTLHYFRVAALPIFDVGVAGLWRLLERVEDLRRFPVVIAAAGMDAALPSVLGGLFPGLIVAVPTSVGYGIAAGGTTALNAILASCASGVVTVNIDNGYGAACAALRALQPLRRRLDPTSTHSAAERQDLAT